MPKTLKNFADSERAREYRNRQRERNYALCPGDDEVRHTRWRDWERRLVMEHDIPDREISRMTGRSVRAIQVMRHKMRKNGEVRTDEYGGRRPHPKHPLVRDSRHLGTHRDSSVAQRRTRWGGCHDPLRHRLHLGKHLRASVGDG